MGDGAALRSPLRTLQQASAHLASWGSLQQQHGGGGAEAAARGWGCAPGSAASGADADPQAPAVYGQWLPTDYEQQQQQRQRPRQQHGGDLLALHDHAQLVQVPPWPTLPLLSWLASRQQGGEGQKEVS